MFYFGLVLFATDYFPPYGSTKSFFCCLYNLLRIVSESRCVINV